MGDVRLRETEKSVQAAWLELQYQAWAGQPVDEATLAGLFRVFHHLRGAASALDDTAPPSRAVIVTTALNFPIVLLAFTLLAEWHWAGPVAVLAVAAYCSYLVGDRYLALVSTIRGRRKLAQLATLPATTGQSPDRLVEETVRQAREQVVELLATVEPEPSDRRRRAYRELNNALIWLDDVAALRR